MMRDDVRNNFDTFRSKSQLKSIEIVVKFANNYYYYYSLDNDRTMNAFDTFIIFAYASDTSLIRYYVCD